MINYKENKHCRLCNFNGLKEVLTLGNQCISAFVETDSPPITAPLDLVICAECNLLQLKHTTNPKILYTDNYGYRTGLNTTMIQEMKNITNSTIGRKKLKENDVIVDIGASDGTLLNFFPKNTLKVAFEPVKKFASYYKGKETILIQDFFNLKSYLDIVGKKAKVITAIAMFYDLDKPNSFLKDITKILDDDGILIIQQNYLPKMLQEGTFDNISHEHNCYYSIATLQTLLNRHNLEIFDVEFSPINGGCFRTFIRFSNNLPYERFKNEMESNIDKLSTFINSEYKKGKKIWIYGASTRGNVILQAARLAYPVISGASERNPEKWGKKTLGTNIPMYSEEEARKIHPDYFLVLPYWFGPEFLEREKKYLESGGKFIFPLPRFKIIGNKHEKN